MMDTKARREAIRKTLKAEIKPLNATVLAQTYGVSRQVIVGDIAILKAQQIPIVATVRGYMYVHELVDDLYTIACCHDEGDTKEELELIVDQGGVIVNVIVDHPLYGELIGKLDIGSRYDIDQFIEKMVTTQAKNLSAVQDGVHLHTLKCKDGAMYERIKEKLKERGFLYE